MAINSRLSPLPEADFDQTKAKHLLNRAGFGGTRHQTRALAEMGLHGAVKYLVDYESIHASKLTKLEIDPDNIREFKPKERRDFRKARRSGDNETVKKFQAEIRKRQVQDRQDVQYLIQWWLGQMLITPRPLEEKLTLLWHGHFASRYRNVRDAYLMQQQNHFLRKHANGSFADLAHGIIRNPAMIKFLNNNTNKKQKPNENLARELMELFTLGEGHYTEQDIKQGAKALTGYTLKDNDFKFNKKQHDQGKKTILGQTGQFDGDDFVDILLQRDDCPRFVAYKIYKHFVADVDDQTNGEQTQAMTVINALAQLIRQHDYQLKPVLMTLFQSQHFYDTTIIGNKIKSPTQLMVGTVRMLNTPTRDISIITGANTMMGQTLFNPPSVAGWDGGQAWINTSTLYVRQNVATYFITGKLPFEDDWTSDDVNYDPMFLLDDLEGSRTIQAVVDHLLDLLLASDVHPQRRESLIAAMQEHVDSTVDDPVVVIALLLLITVMPEYQLC